MRKSIGLLLLLLMSACAVKVDVSYSGGDEPLLTPGQVVSQSQANEWRLLDAENTLYMTLESGVVVFEMLPDLAPNHVANTKALVRQGIFDGTNFYRVIDGFVAQGGPLFESATERQELTAGSYQIAPEFTFEGELGDAYTAFDQEDGYADETGYLKSFAVGRDHSKQETWQLHCYGALAMGRANALDTGGTALYVVNGPAQRYLDRNTTVFGRVVSGMEHIQALKRGANISGPVDLKGTNTIIRIQVAADMPKDDVMPIEVMDSNSASFIKLLASRKNRSNEWFVHQHDYMDACGVPIPMRLRAKE